MPRVSHFEIPADDTDRAIGFYQNVFGWQINRWDGPQDYWLVNTGDGGKPGINGGLLRRMQPGHPVVNSIDVPSVDDYVARITEHGGQIVVPKMPITGVGWLAYFKDTEGNILALCRKMHRQSERAARGECALGRRSEEAVMIVQNYKKFGGAHGETAALKNVLAQAGVVAPHTKEPYTEAMLLGLGGGVGAGYFVFEICGGTWLVLGARHNWQDTGPGFLKTISQRIGAKATVKESGGSKAAEDNLKEALEARRPVITWGSLAGMPYYGLSADLLKMFAHVFVVYGWDEKGNRICVDDRAATPLHVTPRELAVSRSAITSLKNRILTVAPPKKPVDLKAAIEAGIQDCCHEMLNPKIRSFGLPSLEKWADLITDTKDKRGWPQVFKPGLGLYRALLGIYHHIETGGTGGSAFRTMYADFLAEAAGVLGKASQPILEDAAAQYRKSARLWGALANAALPDSVKLLGEAREVTAVKYQLFSAKGTSVGSQMPKIDRRLAAIEAEAAKDFPLNTKQSRELLDELRGHIRKIHDAEEKAVSILQKLAA